MSFDRGCQGNKLNILLSLWKKNELFKKYWGFRINTPIEREVYLSLPPEIASPSCQGSLRFHRVAINMKLAVCGKQGHQAEWNHFIPISAFTLMYVTLIHRWGIYSACLRLYSSIKYKGCIVWKQRIEMFFKKFSTDDTVQLEIKEDSQLAEKTICRL